jgi:uncharacterized protein YggU (UPF0235/DUF167 family)
MCIEYIAKSLKIPKSAVEIVSGHNSRSKRIRVRSKQVGNTAQTKRDRIKKRVHALISKSCI